MPDIRTGLFINNEWRDSAETFSTCNPANGEALRPCSHGSAADVDAAVRAARSAFNTTWGNKIAATQRGALLYKLADLMERDAESLAQLESLNTGKGIRMVRESDIPDAIACLRYYAGLADKDAGQVLPVFGTDKLVYTVHQPIGVCGQIIPWNYPILMWAWKTAPALAAGCTIVMKPSELTPFTALALCDLVKEAGFPPGVLNTVPGLGATTGAAIASHMDIDKVAFTGSVATGRKIAVAAAQSNLKKVTLELGGKSPVLIMSSADVEEAANWTAMGIWFNSGQDCCAGSRVYVQRDVHDAFIAALLDRAKRTAIGLPNDDATSFGPLISSTQQKKVLNYIAQAKSANAKIVTGGKTWDGAPNGFYVEPTIITSADQGSALVQEEVFGPVIAIQVFDTEDEAIRLANDTTYGLAAAVFTRDTKQAMRVTSALDAGTVWCNQYGLLSAAVPFGGFKQSGIGRELGTYGLDAYRQVKAVHHNISQEMPWPL